MIYKLVLNFVNYFQTLFTILCSQEIIQNKVNIKKNCKIFQNIKKELSLALKSWMVSQNDFLITHKMPLLKPTLHPLDKVSQWNKVDEDLVNKLVSENYLQLHY